MTFLLPFLIALVLLLLLAALALGWRARRLRAQSGVPYVARVVYADTGAWERAPRPLFSRRLGLAGKPDYLVQIGDQVIPVEVKPGRTAREPRLSDVLQLMAYGLLVAEDTGRAPSHGLLKYRDALYRIEFTPELQQHLDDTLAAMRLDLLAPEVDRSHADTWRCRACGYRDSCDQALD